MRIKGITAAAGSCRTECSARMPSPLHHQHV